MLYFTKDIKNLFSYRFKLTPPYSIGGGTHFSGGTNPDSGGTFVPPFKLLKYALLGSGRFRFFQKMLIAGYQHTSRNIHVVVQ